MEISNSAYCTYCDGLSYSSQPASRLNCASSGKGFGGAGRLQLAREILGSQSQVFTELTRVGQLAGYLGRPGMLNWKKIKRKREKCVMQYAYSEQLKHHFILPCIRFQIFCIEWIEKKLRNLKNRQQQQIQQLPCIPFQIFCIKWIEKKLRNLKNRQQQQIQLVKVLPMSYQAKVNYQD